MLDSLEVNIKDNQRIYKNELVQITNTSNVGDKSDRILSDESDLTRLIEEGKSETGFLTERFSIGNRSQLIK